MSRRERPIKDVRGTGEGEKEGKEKGKGTTAFDFPHRVRGSAIHERARAHKYGEEVPRQISPKQTAARGRLDLFSRLMHG